MTLTASPLDSRQPTSMNGRLATRFLRGDSFCPGASLLSSCKRQISSTIAGEGASFERQGSRARQELRLIDAEAVSGMANSAAALSPGRS